MSSQTAKDGTFHQSYLTPSGKSTGAWSYLPEPFWPFLPIFYPGIGYPLYPEMGWPTNYCQYPAVPPALPVPQAAGPSTSALSSCKQNYSASALEEEECLMMLRPYS